MANVLVHGYKINMRIDHALFYYFFGERTVPKNVNEWLDFWEFFVFWLIAISILWIASYIPGFGIEMTIGIFCFSIYYCLYKPTGNLYKPIIIGGVSYYLYITKQTFMLTILGFHLESYFLLMLMGLCAINLLYRIYNRAVWFFYDRIIKRYKLPIPDQGLLQQDYFNRNYIATSAYKKSLTAFKDFEQAQAFEANTK